MFIIVYLFLKGSLFRFANFLIDVGFIVLLLRWFHSLCLKLLLWFCRHSSMLLLLLLLLLLLFVKVFRRVTPSPLQRFKHFLGCKAKTLHSFNLFFFKQWYVQYLPKYL